MSAPYDSKVITRNEQGHAVGPAVGPLGAGSPSAGRRPLMLAGAGAMFISGSAVLVTLAATPAATTAFYRCFLALPALIALATAEQRRLGTRRPAARIGAVVAGIFLGIDLVLWNHAIDAVGAGVATVLGNLQVLFVALAAWILFRERPGRRFLVMLPVVLAGVALVSGLAGSSASGMHPAAGVGYGVATSLAYAVFLLILRRTSSGTPHVAGPLAEATAGSALAAIVLGLIFGGLHLEVPGPSLGWLVVLALSSQTAGWLLITSSLPRLPAASSSLIQLLQPAASMLLAALVLGQRPSLLQIAGAALVCGGVLAASAVRPSRPAAGAPLKPDPARAAAPS